MQTRYNKILSIELLKGEPLVRPDHIPIDIFLNEITFYRLNLATITEFLEIEGLLRPPEVEKDLPNCKRMGLLVVSMNINIHDRFTKGAVRKVTSTNESFRN